MVSKALLYPCLQLLQALLVLEPRGARVEGPAHREAALDIALEPQELLIEVVLHCSLPVGHQPVDVGQLGKCLTLRQEPFEVSRSEPAARWRWGWHGRADASALLVVWAASGLDATRRCRGQ